jgi:predicted lactoylglutathione lyase
MPTMIFPNLPVKDLERATTFYTQLGFEKNPQFSDENASSIVISDTIVVMLLRHEYFSTFTKKTIADSTAQTEVLLGLSADSKEDVDTLVGKAIAAGGSEPRETQDLGFMYGRAFEDLDGHTWEVFYMDPSAIQQ